MRENLVRFWHGDLPLGESFWTYHIAYGAVLHIGFTCIALILFASEAPTAIGAAMFLLPNIFTFAAAVAVWRSADRFRGNPLWAEGAKAGAIVWAIVCIFI